MQTVIPALNKRVFNEQYDTIHREIDKRRSKWTLTAIAGWLDWDDVRQVLLLHVYKKINQWNPEMRPIEVWLNRLISNQLKNLGRNVYSNFTKPCLKCPFNTGDNACDYTKSGIQCGECVLYKKWEFGKKRKHDVQLPVSMENHSQEVFNKPCESLNYEEMHGKINDKMKTVLTRSEYDIYKCLFIDFKTDEETIKALSFKQGVRRISIVKKIILNKVKAFIREEFNE